MSKNVLNYQISVMLLDNIPTDYDFNELASNVKKSFPELGGCGPMMPPYNPGDNLPVEIPRFVYQTPDVTVQASSVRLDFIFQLKNKDLFNSIDNTIINIDKLLHTLELDLSYRFGVVLNIELTKDEMWKSLDALLKNESLKIKKEIQFSYLDNLDIGYNGIDITLNSWFRYILAEKTKKYICILDINTPAEKIFKLKTHKLKEVYDAIFKEKVEVSVSEC